jgi:TfoX/Sxy family transcriptional regulator of competence genes
MVTDEEVAAALGLHTVNALLAIRKNHDELNVVKSAVREKWCDKKKGRSVCVNYGQEETEVCLWNEIDLYDEGGEYSSPSELSCWKEALVWIDKKEKEDAPAS